MVLVETKDINKLDIKKLYMLYTVHIVTQQTYISQAYDHATVFIFHSPSSPDLPTTGGSLKGPVPLTVMAATITE